MWMEWITDVERIDWREDKINLVDTNEIEKLYDDIEKKLWSNIDIEEYVKDKIEFSNKMTSLVENLNSRIDDYLDISFRDWWDIDVDDGSREEFEAVKLISDKFNNIVERFISSNEHDSTKLLEELWELENQDFSSEIKWIISWLEEKKLETNLWNSIYSIMKHARDTESALAMLEKK